MGGPNRNKGPWLHRVLVWLLAVVLALLVFWLLGYVLGDIGSWRGPDYDEFEEARIDRALLDTQSALRQQADDTQRAVNELKIDQANLRDSMDNSRDTMNEMRATYRLALDQGVTPTPAQEDALAESERLFLDNQRRYQQTTEELAGLNARLREISAQQRSNDEALADAREPIDEAYSEAYERHRLKVAAVKLAVLLPLLMVAVWLFVKYRTRLYGPLVYAYGIAVALQVGLVMHDYFPEMYFRYILFAVAIAIVVLVLLHLLRTVAFPKRDWLLKQYREAYEAFLCPVCGYPIRRGPLKYGSWTRRSIRRQPVPAGAEAGTDEPYTCPVCSTALYEECASCGATRHALLPACARCGAVKEPDAAANDRPQR